MPRIFCIGRNYSDHASELGNDVPDKPIIFMKPYSSLATGSTIQYPRHGHQLHFEAELVIQIGQAGQPENPDEADAFVAGFGIGLDLTLRDVQTQLKNKGHPWEIAKAFDDSATVSNITAYKQQCHRLDHLLFACLINNQLKQQGNTAEMIFSPHDLICYIAKIWSLEKGDLIYTGTPKGVGQLSKQDNITVSGDYIQATTWQVV